MSNPVFPQLPGQGWPLSRSPIWKTGVQTTQSGRELRTGFMAYPLYKWTATFELLRNSASFAEFQQLIAFFNTCAGQLQVFNFADPDDFQATAQGLGVGDGVTRSFQLFKAFGGFVEPVLAPNVITQVTLNGSATSAYTANFSTGVITFTTAPASGVVIAWTGTYYFLCRFLADTYTFDRNMSNYYGVQTLEFTSVKL
jgi:uncharacterized protein (TIGR02217 family)